MPHIERPEAIALREVLTRLVEAVEAHVTLGYDESDDVFDARAEAKAVLGRPISEVTSP